MTEQRYCKRLIEVDLPIKRISAFASREKSIRHGHISTLHIWWARRPLAACRAIICAALLPDPADPLCPESFRQKASQLMEQWRNRRGGRQRNWSDSIEIRLAILDFIAEYSDWENSNNKDFIDLGRMLSQSAHESLGGLLGTRPVILDPFAGGGSIPLEAARLGADVIASDLNPIAILQNKVILEQIPRYGLKLSEEVLKWSARIREEAKKDLDSYYPDEPGGGRPVAYLWARTIKCTGPNCGIDIPMFQTGQLVKIRRKNVGLELKVHKKNISFEIKDNPKCEGTVRRGSVICPVCGYTTPVAEVRKQLKEKQGGTADAYLMAVVLENKNSLGRSYRLPTERDIEAYHASVVRLNEIVKQKGLDAIPAIELPLMSGVFNVPLYGMDRWDLIFTPRQRLLLYTLSQKIRDISNEIDCEQGLKEAIITCLAFAVDKCADFHSSLTTWIPVGEKIGHTFGRQALGMIWDYAEAVPFSDISGSWDRCIDYIRKVIEKNMAVKANNITVMQTAVQNHPLPNDSVHLVVTDPPYYNAVPFADLSDFFYVWISKILAPIYPELFKEKVAPKEDEIAELSGWDERRYKHKNKEYYQKEFCIAMTRVREIVMHDGLCVVFFAHKSTSGWEATIAGLIDAGWIITASWPLDTERSGRLRAMNSAVLASSVQLVCRPRENSDGTLKTLSIGDWRDVLTELPKRIHEWMPRLSDEGVVGADAIFACLGPALEIFSRYSHVEKANGEKVNLREYLEQVWGAVAKEALNMIFQGAHTEGFEEDARLTAMWLWTLSAGSDVSVETDAETKEDADSDSGGIIKTTGFSLEFDAARKIAQGLGAHLENLSSVIEVKGDHARLLPVAERVNFLFGKGSMGATPVRKKKKENQITLFDEFNKIEEQGWSLGDEKSAVGKTILDRLHQAMILFGAGRGDAMRRFLVEEGIGKDERFWRLAQALSALYPSNTDEKRWVDGVLARKKGLGF